MRWLSLLTVLMAVICCIIPNIVRVAEEVDYYILSVLCVIAGLLAEVCIRLEKK